jgi:uncharacterized cupredoxin-like copper-binding protein
MIKIFMSVGVVGGLLIAYLATFAVGPVAQLPPPESLLVGFREEGAVPKSLNLVEDESIDHDVFGVPEEDEVQLAIAEKAMAASMPEMNMAEGETMPAEDGETMQMAEGETMPADEGETMPAADGDTMQMPEAAGGLLITADGAFDREIDLKMTEWGFSEMNIEVKKGERIRFNVTNDGEILHEFMVMQMTQMQAVTYRMTRADWSLLEHEALFEKALVLPGGDFSFVLEIQENGAWMFMCMLPYHMQLGMMGQMSTAGAAMEM